MRILIVNRMLGTLLGGGETFDLNVARRLVKLGYNVTIITAKPLFSNIYLSYPNLRIIYLSTLDLHYLEAKIRHYNQKLGAIFRYIDNYIFQQRVFSWLLHTKAYQQYDIIQCCGMFWLPKWVIARFNIPVVLGSHGPPSRLMQVFIRDLISHPHFGLFCLGDSVKVLESQVGLVQGIDFEVIEPGVDLAIAESYNFLRDTIRSDLSIPNGTVVGITVARLILVKNIPFLIEGIEQAVHAVKIPFVWFMVGEGPERFSLERLAEKKGLHGCIRWLGQMKPDDVHKFLAAADIFALTSSYESFSIATLEAMAHRLPIVGTNVGYLKTLIQESKGGILVELGDVEGLSRAIVRLASDSNYRRRLGENGWIYVQRFDWPNIIMKLLNFYEQVITGRRPINRVDR